MFLSPFKKCDAVGIPPSNLFIDNTEKQIILSCWRMVVTSVQAYLLISFCQSQVILRDTLYKEEFTHRHKRDVSENVVCPVAEVDASSVSPGKKQHLLVTKR